jgi:hypothetical protein
MRLITTTYCAVLPYITVIFSLNNCKFSNTNQYFFSVQQVFKLQNYRLILFSYQNKKRVNQYDVPV